MTTLKQFLLPPLLAIATLCSTVVNAADLMNVHLEGIADGDTIYVRDLSGRTSFKVRIAGIDAPEKTQSYGAGAKAALSQLLRGSALLTLETHGHDQYGRVIAIVKDERGRDVGTALVAQGAAWVFEQYARLPEYKALYPTMHRAEANAKAQRIGLWAEDNPVEPWRYRQSNH